jgi:hypothetical protein
VVKIFGDFPFMLSLVEAFLGFFSRIIFVFLRGLDSGSAWHGVHGWSIRGLCITSSPGAINLIGYFAMMERRKGYSVSGSALPCPPITCHWE